MKHKKIRICAICGKEFTIKKQKKKILSIDDVLKIGRKHNIVGYANIVKFIEENGITQ